MGKFQIRLPIRDVFARGTARVLRSSIGDPAGYDRPGRRPPSPARLSVHGHCTAIFVPAASEPDPEGRRRSAPQPYTKDRPEKDFADIRALMFGPEESPQLSFAAPGTVGLKSVRRIWRPVLSY
jgi:hypothetical protein